MQVSTNTVNLAYDGATDSTVTVTYNGRGTLTATGGTHTSTSVNNKTITIAATELDDDYTDTVLVNVSAAGNYYSDTATVTVYGNFSPLHFQPVASPSSALTALLGQLAQGNTPDEIFNIVDSSELEGYTYAGHKILQAHGRRATFPASLDIEPFGFSVNADTRLLFINYDSENDEVMDAQFIEPDPDDTFEINAADDDNRFAVVVYQPE